MKPPATKISKLHIIILNIFNNYLDSFTSCALHRHSFRATTKTLLQ